MKRREKARVRTTELTQFIIRSPFVVTATVTVAIVVLLCFLLVNIFTFEIGAASVGCRCFRRKLFFLHS